METEKTTRLASELGASVTKTRNYTVVTVKPEKIVEAVHMVAVLLEDGEFYHLTTITGVDEGEVITMLYHFWRGREFVVVKTSVPKTNASLPSITGTLPAAVLYEGEITDLLGVAFVGNPLAGKRLLLPDNYPTDAPPPLRKEMKDLMALRKSMGLE